MISNHCISICSILILHLLAHSSISLQVPIKINTTKTSINYNSQLVTCRCDLTVGVCDFLCCCDSDCLKDTTATWTSLAACKPSSLTVPIEQYCSQVTGTESASALGLDSLLCLEYSSRGAIGYYYPDPLTLSTTLINPPKSFSYYAANMNVTTQPPQPLTLNDYNSTYHWIKTKTTGAVTASTISYLRILTPGIDSNCKSGYLSLSISEQSNICLLALTPTNCQSIYNIIGGVGLQICANGGCATSATITGNINTVLAAKAQPTISADKLTCRNVIETMKITLGVSSSDSGVYTINTADIQVTVVDVPLGVQSGMTGIRNLVTVRTDVTIVAGTKASGSPGYLKGMKIVLNGIGTDQTSGKTVQTLTQSSTTHQCLTTLPFPLELPFGVRKVFSCRPKNDPCTSTEPMDQLALNTFFYKWARQAKTLTSTEEKITLNVSKTATCDYNLLALTILYAEAGWSQEPQNYIIGAKLEPIRKLTGITDRTLTVQWIKVTQTQLAGTIGSRFYEYFKLLWEPLRRWV